LGDLKGIFGKEGFCLRKANKTEYKIWTALMDKKVQEMCITSGWNVDKSFTNEVLGVNRFFGLF